MTALKKEANFVVMVQDISIRQKRAFRVIIKSHQKVIQYIIHFSHE